jgi:hypothetical protein
MKKKFLLKKFKNKSFFPKCVELKFKNFQNVAVSYHSKKVVRDRKQKKNYLIIPGIKDSLTDTGLHIHFVNI